MATLSGQPKTIKIINNDVIKQIIKEHGPITKPEISRISKLSLATVNKIVDDLEQNEVIYSLGKVDSTGGRKATAYKINGDMGVILGLYYVQNTVICFIANISGELKHKEYAEISDEQKATAAVEFLSECIKRLIEISENKSILAVGIGIPGVVKNGVISNIPNIKSLEKVNLKQIIEKQYDIRTFIENEVNLTTMGIFYEKYSKKASNMLFMYVGEGIGSGLIINDELYKGFSNFAGEVSYLTIDKSLYEEEVPPRYKGSFENSIASIGKKLSENPLDKEVSRAFVDTLTIALLNVMCVVNPEIILIHCDFLNKKNFEQIKTNLQRVIDVENISKLIMFKASEMDNIKGTMSMCLREINSGSSISKRKGD